MSGSSVQPFFASDLALADNAKISISQVYIPEVKAEAVKHPKDTWILSIQRLNKTLNNKRTLHVLLKIKRR